MFKKIKPYYQLMKPGVMYGNVLTGAAGFWLAAAGAVDWWLFAATIGGMTLVVGGACAFNNFLDRDIDSKMERTKKRPSVQGAMPAWAMATFALVVTAIGTGILAIYTNWLVVTIGVLGWIIYVWLYGAWGKRTSIHGTIPGSISGAMPIAGGYAAVSGQVDAGLAVAFLIMFFWQFPEFYSIAIYRRKEYAAAKVPLISVVKGSRSTALQIVAYTVAYVASTLALTPLGYTGWVYFTVMALAGAYWLWLAAKALPLRNEADLVSWARRMFRTAMWQVLLLCLMLGIGPLLP